MLNSNIFSFIKIFYFYIINSFGFISLIIKLNISITKYIFSNLIKKLAYLSFKVLYIDLLAKAIDYFNPHFDPEN